MSERAPTYPLEPGISRGLDVSLRPVEPGDLETICSHRAAMFRDAGWPVASVAAMTATFRAWLSDRLDDGTYFGFLAMKAGVPIGGVGLMVIAWPPHPLHPATAKRGYILNVYVERSARRRGVARRLMAASDQAFSERGISYLALHASDAGQPLYEGLGWGRTSEMAKQLAV